jgi:phenylacetate-CoA ligase
VLLARQLGAETACKVVSYSFPFSSYKDICTPLTLERAGTDLDRQLGEKCDYILFIGVVQANKGIASLLRAWSEVECGANQKLVIAGKWVKSGDRWQGAIERARNCVVIDRYVSDEEFVVLISRARCVVLPYSEYAHSSVLHSCANQGKAVIVSDIPLFKELLPGYELMFSVNNWQALKRVLEQVLSMSTDELKRHGDRVQCYAEKARRTLTSGVWSTYAAPRGELTRHRDRESGSQRRERYYLALPRPLQTAAVNIIGWQHKRTRMGWEFWQELSLLEASDRYSAGELAALQQERLKALIKAAYTDVPFYRHAFSERGLRPEDIRSAGDLVKLPVLEKSTVNQFGQSMISASVSRRKCVPGHTSGSTGTSLQLLYDRRALAAEFGTVWRLRRRWGCDCDDWHATFAGRLCVPRAQTTPPFHRVNYVQRQVLFSLYHLNVTSVTAYAEALSERRFQFYSGYPSALESLLMAADQANCAVPYPDKAIFTSSESLPAWQRLRLERRLGVPVKDRYGCAEFCVSFTVCEKGRYHADSECCIVECEPLEEHADWVRGELICTGLMNHAMPFIRYRVGDVATIAKTPCPCGRASLSAYAIDGRREDFVVTKDGVRLGRLDHLFKDMDRIRESQIVQERPGRMKIRIVRSPEYTVADERMLLAECDKRMGDRMEIELEYIADIPRNAAGKFRAVINTMPDHQRYANHA